MLSAHNFFLITFLMRRHVFIEVSDHKQRKGITLYNIILQNDYILISRTKYYNNRSLLLSFYLIQSTFWYFKNKFKSFNLWNLQTNKCSYISLVSFGDMKNKTNKLIFMKGKSATTEVKFCRILRSRQLCNTPSETWWFKH